LSAVAPEGVIVYRRLVLPAVLVIAATTGGVVGGALVATSAVDARLASNPIVSNVQAVQPPAQTAVVTTALPAAAPIAIAAPLAVATVPAPAATPRAKARATHRAKAAAPAVVKPKATLRPTPAVASNTRARYVNVSAGPKNHVVTAWCPTGYAVLSGGYYREGIGWEGALYNPGEDVATIGEVSSGGREGWRAEQLVNNGLGLGYTSISVHAKCGLK
jgi:hypothetical protein